MRLYEEISKLLDGEAFALSRCLIIPLGGGYFQGVKAVGDFSEERIELYFSSVKLCVQGKGLVIKKYCDGDLILSGKITALTTQGEGE